jgi:hypothetical protein
LKLTRFFTIGRPALEPFLGRIEALDRQRLLGAMIAEVLASISVSFAGIKNARNQLIREMSHSQMVFFAPSPAFA